MSVSVSVSVSASVSVSVSISVSVTSIIRIVTIVISMNFNDRVICLIRWGGGTGPRAVMIYSQGRRPIRSSGPEIWVAILHLRCVIYLV